NVLDSPYIGFVMTDQQFLAAEEEAPELSLRDIIQAAHEPTELGIPISIVYDLIMKILFNEGEASIRRLSEVIKVMPSVIDKLIEQMQQEHLAEVARAAGAGRFSYLFKLSEAGERRARDAFERNQYIGPAPVAIDVYNKLIMMQTESRSKVTPPEVQR